MKSEVKIVIMTKIKQVRDVKSKKLSDILKALVRRFLSSSTSHLSTVKSCKNLGFNTG